MLKIKINHEPPTWGLNFLRITPLLNMGPPFKIILQILLSEKGEASAT